MGFGAAARAVLADFVLHHFGERNSLKSSRCVVPGSGAKLGVHPTSNHFVPCPKSRLFNSREPAAAIFWIDSKTRVSATLLPPLRPARFPPLPPPLNAAGCAGRRRW